MFKVEKAQDTKVAIEIGGLITADEMSQGIDTLTTLVNGMPKAQILALYHEIEMPAAGAMMEEFKRLPQMFGMISHLDKVAVVSDQAWIRNMAELEGMVLPGVELRSFPHSARAQADAFLDGVLDDSVDDDENFPV